MVSKLFPPLFLQLCENIQEKPAYQRADREKKQTIWHLQFILNLFTICILLLLTESALPQETNPILSIYFSLPQQVPVNIGFKFTQLRMLIFTLSPRVQLRV